MPLHNLPSSPSGSPTQPGDGSLSTRGRTRGELAFKPCTIEPILPKRTYLRVRRGMRALVRWAFGRGTVCALAHVDALSVDALEVVGLGVRTRAERTARTLGTALIGMMAPALTASAMDRAGMRASALDLTVRAADGHKLGNIETGVRARHCVVDVDPCPA
ncbi:hypothetical protein Agabi119p4_3475 [Agaricus bisporus var. burnettii]|uniref:Uncharacterized protein n=1 Tax=Agaricus bisporus var. burnettii TaxID=192524 RepID=A0A8H7F7J9_AGABI|nr:hypothetical protein Agabi119p4_3475 [Agaricus bisporus var. burnettii]